MELLLASSSPRRRELLNRLGFAYEILQQDLEESYPSDLAAEGVPAFLAKAKAKSCAGALKNSKQVILTADTIVLLDGQILGKPEDLDQARTMLERLSGRRHRVITAVYLLAQNRELALEDQAWVDFLPIETEALNHYLEHYQVLDKAGAYAVQEGIGLSHIRAMEGSYFTVMGLPTHLVYRALKEWPTED